MSLTDLNARVVYALTTAMLGVLIYELVYNGKEQGNPFSFKVRGFLTFGYSVGGAIFDRPHYSLL